MSDYPKWQKIPRLYNETFSITEKIDGTNGLIYVAPHSDVGLHLDAPVTAFAGERAILAGSRKRWIAPDQDNHGFAAWVHEHAETLAEALGAGHHYGEWAGPGINGNRHGLEEKTFFLFNWRKPYGIDAPLAMQYVPVLTTGVEPSQAAPAAYSWASVLDRDGSEVGPGRAEGVILRSDLTGQMWKYFCGGAAANATTKGQAA